MSDDIQTGSSETAVLDFDKLKDLIASYAVSSGGKTRARDLQPRSSAPWIRGELAAAEEAVAAEASSDPLPIRGLHDVGSHLAALRAGAVLEPADLLEIAGHLRVAHGLRRFLDKRGIQARFPMLAQRGSTLVSQPGIEARIERTVGPDGDVLDTASADLRRIRTDIRRTRARIQERLHGLLDDPGHADAIQDRLVTLRNDRYVIPIKENFKGHFRGIVQNRSSSGATLFVEPDSVVQSNNALHELAGEERLEIARVLAQVSDLLREHGEQLETNAHVLAEFDILRAKAGFWLDYRCNAPQIVDEAVLDLRGARHPLLESYFRREAREHPNEEPRQVVAMDLAMDEGLRGLVITGPNTGGKTVVVKTVGLLVLMVQSGLPIPVDEGSVCGVFDCVYADIGDEQSIEQSLSTFSGHMRHVIHAVRNATSQSLVILDELGAGTDPVEGVPLATAVLDELIERGCLVLATTHHGALKLHAHSHAIVENASLEFDEKTLSPNFHLRIGIPGRSHALSIAARLGLPDGVLKTATERVGSQAGRLEALIADVERLKASAESDKKTLQETLSRAEEDHREVDRLRTELETHQTRLMRKAEEEAGGVLAEARATIERAVAELRRTNASKEAITMAHRSVDDATHAIHARKQQDLREAAEALADVAAGDRVYVTSLRSVGVVQETPTQRARGVVRVKVGEMTLTVPATDVRADIETAPVEDLLPKRFQAIASRKRSSIALELDVRGTRALEAVERVDKYLDDAVLAGLERVVIIHGKGTGALRHALHEHLASHPHVDGYRLGAHDEGDAGVTVIQLAG